MPGRRHWLEGVLLQALRLVDLEPKGIPTSFLRNGRQQNAASDGITRSRTWIRSRNNQLTQTRTGGCAEVCPILYRISANAETSIVQPRCHQSEG